jgi:hypothetical protein
MTTDMNQLQEATNKLQPIYDKLVSGNTSLSQEEIDTFGDTFKTWHDYTTGRS